MGNGFRTATSGGVAAPPYTNGPYTFSENITFEGTVTVQGTFTFGDAAADNFIVQGDLRINDDRFLHFGSDEDVSIEYDENGDNELKIVGADWRFDDDLKVKFGAGGDAWIEYDEDGNDTLSFGGADLLVEDDLKLYFGSGKDAYIYYDESSNDVLELSGSANGIWLSKAGGAKADNMVLLGAGTSASPATTSAADKSFIEFRTESTATSGDSRGLYWRHALNGAGVSGEAIRAFSKITAACATARGAHISFDLGSGGSVSGLGVGVDAQILVGDAAVSAGGTYAVINAEIYSAGSSSDMGAVTEVSFQRFANSGDSSGAANIDDDAFLFVLTGFTSGSGHLWYDNQKAAPPIEEFVRVKTPSGVRYLALYDANA